MKQALVLIVLLACGGGSKNVKSQEDKPFAPNETGEATRQPPPLPGEEAKPPESRPAGGAMTFALKNPGDRDVMFTTSKGWQAVVFAYTGKPPKAKSVLLFENACSASCDAAEADRCPVCKEPKNRKEEEKLAKHEMAAAGGEYKLGWDGKILTYEKTKAGRRSCKCWRKSDPPPGTYTVKACGLRAPKKTGSGSSPVCAEAEVTLPATEPTVTLDFGQSK